MSPFEFLAQDPDKNDLFNKAMTETAELSGSIFVNAYNFGKHKLIIDIGGGQGHLLIADSCKSIRIHRPFCSISRM